jgi:hypothetical protein
MPSGTIATLPFPCLMMLDAEEQPHELPERPWIVLQTTYDIEAWIDNYNRELRYELERTGAKPNVPGYGICFRLEHGGDVYLHTDAEGNVMLDVTPDAEWVAPLISAATNVAVPASRIWALPGDVLTQLVFGLNPLIAATRIVLRHEYRLRKSGY